MPCAAKTCTVRLVPVLLLAWNDCTKALSPYGLSCWWDVKHKHNNMYNSFIRYVNVVARLNRLSMSHYNEGPTIHFSFYSEFHSEFQC